MVHSGLNTLPLKIPLARHDLGGLYRAHLGDPLSIGLHLANRPELVTGVARDTDVVGTLQNELDVADLKNLGSSLLCIAGRRVEDTLREAIGETKDGLKRNATLADCVTTNL